MPRRGPPSRPSKYQPLADSLAAQERDTVHLTFAQIEAIVGFALPDSAYDYPSFWTHEPSKVGRTLATAGWRARLLIREQAVVFTRERRKETGP